MSNIKFELNREGVKELLKSQPVKEACKTQADIIASNANGMHPGYEAVPRDYPKRSGYAVKPATEEAYWDNYHHNTLLKARGK